MTKVKTKSYNELKKELYEFTNNDPYMALVNKAEKLGLRNLWAYHCNRCNYVWFHKDFDMSRDRYELGKRKIEIVSDFGEDLFYREPQRACARCKSRYRNTLPTRKTENTFQIGKYSIHQEAAIPTYRAAHRTGLLAFAVENCNCHHCDKLRNKKIN